MNILLELINAILPAISAIVGALIGGYFTRKAQHDLLDIEIAKEENKEKRRRETEVLTLYNKILKIDGEEMLVVHLAGPGNEFEIDIFVKKIRPLIYEKFHIVHKDIADLVRQIDEIIAACNYYEDFTLEDHQNLVRIYFKIISHVQRHIENYREQNKIFHEK
ncbi:hypothetical protein [Fervidibacillus albus]|uniref:Uncharacterized protein n=1 Tax=Fervidibacillus albus TaxID=2980026 RepID=A0A9E8RX64_9BACI|nr:hypothetical protein [Fervidibacillus albus]WAA10833.1 hypothetical protein OE104_05840 [Fervidibacillus albus]